MSFLPARRLGVGDAARVQQLLERLPARRRQPILERLAVLLDQEVGLEPDVDVDPRAGAPSPGSSRGSARRRARCAPPSRRSPGPTGRCAARRPSRRSGSRGGTPPPAGRPTRRSPREKIPSMCDCWFSCILRSTRSARAPLGQQRLLARGLGLAVHRRPLERRVRLRHVRRHRRGHLRAALVAAADLLHARRGLDDADARPRRSRSAGRS